MASLPNEALSAEIEERASRLGLSAEEYLRWLIDPEKRNLITYLEKAEASGREGAGFDPYAVLAELRKTAPGS